MPRLRDHHYAATVTWTGNEGSGTSGYSAYNRQYLVEVAGKPDLLGSADPFFRGDADRYNPEDLLLIALSACHMLSYLHLCAVNNIIVLDYVDRAEGIMTETAGGGGKFSSVTLHPRITVTPGSNRELAGELHHQASLNCFIAASVNFPVLHEPELVFAETGTETAQPA
jgi:organic hydroperoxide reductase OsmC/OhrA